MGYVKLTGTTNRHSNWTTEFVLERDEETGDPTKVVKINEPINLTKEDQEKVESFGGVFEKSSKEESDEFEANRPAVPVVGADVIASGPVFDTPSTMPNQNVVAPQSGADVSDKP